MPKDKPPKYTTEEKAAMVEGDSYRARVLRRTGLKREELSCPRAKSDMTPCVARDGGLAVCFVHSRPACVGCEWSLMQLNAKENAHSPPQTHTERSADAPDT